VTGGRWRTIYGRLSSEGQRSDCAAAAPCRGEWLRSGQSHTAREGHAARVSGFSLV